MAQMIDVAQFDHAARQQPQAPAQMSFGRRTTGQGDQMGFAMTVELVRILAVDDPVMIQCGRQARRHHGLTNAAHGHVGNPKGSLDGRIRPSGAGGAGLGFEQDLGVHNAARGCLTAPHQFAALPPLIVGKLHHILFLGHWGRPRGVM